MSRKSTVASRPPRVTLPRSAGSPSSPVRTPPPITNSTPASAVLRAAVLVLGDVAAEVGERQQEQAVELARLPQVTGEGAQAAPEFGEEDPVLRELIDVRIE